MVIFQMPDNLSLDAVEVLLSLCVTGADVCRIDPEICSTHNTHFSVAEFPAVFAFRAPDCGPDLRTALNVNSHIELGIPQ